MAKKTVPLTGVLAAAKSTLIGIIAFEDRSLPPSIKSLNEESGGRVIRKLRQKGFSGKKGEVIVIDISEMFPTSHASRYMVLVGLGRRRQAKQLELCAAYSRFLTTGKELNVNELVVLLTPDRMEGLTIPVEAAARVLRCRTEIEPRLRKGTVDKVRIITSAKDHARAQVAFEGAKQQCPICIDPQLPVLGQ
jgi:hypothetical protein